MALRSSWEAKPECSVEGYPVTRSNQFGQPPAVLAHRDMHTCMSNKQVSLNKNRKRKV